MAQTGDPTGTGTGGSGKKWGAEFSDEPFTRGAVGMARAQDPDSGDSQFFICFDDAQFLNKQYTVWGRVSDGMEFVDNTIKFKFFLNDLSILLILEKLSMNKNFLDFGFKKS